MGCGNDSDTDSDGITDSIETAKRTLPYIGLHDVQFVMRHGRQVADTVFHIIPPYAFLAHDSSLFTNERVAGKIHIANFFFTSCPAICPAMIEQMRRLQEATTDIEELTFLSHTIDPVRDSIPRLREYIAERNLKTDNWFFLYGPKDEVYVLGEEGYMINAMEDEYAEGGFLHSEHFVLIDREGHIRGLYDGTDVNEVNQLEKDIRMLIKDEYGS